MYQTNPPLSPQETLPTMYDLPSEDPEESGVPSAEGVSLEETSSETPRVMNFIIFSRSCCGLLFSLPPTIQTRYLLAVTKYNPCEFFQDSRKLLDYDSLKTQNCHLGSKPSPHTEAKAEPLVPSEKFD
jgi:hypothetical protein